MDDKTIKLNDLSPEDAERLDWRFMEVTLRKCREALEQDGSNQSWIGPAIAVAAERAALAAKAQ